MEGVLRGGTNLQDQVLRPFAHAVHDIKMAMRSGISLHEAKTYLKDFTLLLRSDILILITRNLLIHESLLHGLGDGLAARA